MNEKKFLAFIDKMTTSKNAALMEAVKKGFKVCCEGRYDDDYEDNFIDYDIFVKDPGIEFKRQRRQYAVITLCDESVVAQLDAICPGFSDYMNDMMSAEMLTHRMLDNPGEMDDYQWDENKYKIANIADDFLSPYLNDDVIGEITPEEWKERSGQEMPADFSNKMKAAVQFLLDNLNIGVA